MKRLALSLSLLVTLITLTIAGDERPAGLDLGGFDPKVRPQDDLFAHVNGRWVLATEIPPDKSNYGSFTALDDAARANIRGIIEDAVRQPGDASGRKIGDFYQSYMDEEIIDKKGIEPLRTELAAIDALASKDDLVAYFGRAGQSGIASPAGFLIAVDDKNSARYLAGVMQQGLTLPDRDYYLDDKETYRNARQALVTYVTRLFELAKLPEGAEAAQAILKLETSLAEVHWSRTELRDAEKRYNLYRVAD